MPRELCVLDEWRVRGTEFDGAGENERPKGLGRGGLVDLDGALRGVVRNVMDVRRFGVEDGRGEGLGLRLKSMWSTLGLEFHRGLLSCWDRAGRAGRVPGIGVDEDFDREGEALRESESDVDPEFLRESCKATPCGMLAYLRELAGRDVLFETTLLRRLERLMAA